MGGTPVLEPRNLLLPAIAAGSAIVILYLRKRRDEHRFSRPLWQWLMRISGGRQSSTVTRFLASPGACS